ncbi:MAG: lipopolysaccharide biosynthesis protein RfbH [Endomicrobium sp.]|jgi:CDP-6-deoxy-D-xylo-4-hexulose-3-dehydrase|nr:lipopolysaccharide biosynthesis protein RfbH [Endomicrobium sp.]
MRKKAAVFLRKAVKTLAGIYYRLAMPDVKTDGYIPVSGKVLGVEELKNMLDASLDMWLTTGRFNDEFEKEFARFLDVKYALTTNSGSSANLLAISALTSHKLGNRRLSKGNEVITVASGFPTTIAPIIQNGLVPVFVDVEIGTYNVIVDQIEEAITPKTKAVFMAHTLGNVFDLARVKEICDRRKLWLIEDSCDALGSRVDGKYTGTVGHIGTFSFYPAHHITMGEGGAVCTNDSQLYKILISLRDWGRDCWCNPGKDNTCGKRFSMKFGNMPQGYDHKYIYSHLGYNLKITDWQAAIGIAQLKKIKNLIKKRHDNFNYLYKKLEDLQDYIILPKTSENAEPSWFGFLISVDPNDRVNKQQIVEHLEKNMIGTRQLFAGNILRQPCFVENNINLRIRNSEIKKSNALTEEDYKLLPNADFIMNNSFWVGIYPAIDKMQLDKMSENIHEFIRQKM